MAGGPTTTQRFRVTLVVDGVDWGVWDTKAGGKMVGNTQMYKPGGLGPQVALPGAPSVEAITLTRLYRLERDHDRIQKLYDGVGEARCVVKQLPIGPDGNAYGRPIVWSGLLESVDPPGHDSMQNNPAMITVEISPDGNPHS